MNVGTVAMGDQVGRGLLSPFLRARRMGAVRRFLTGRVLDFGCGAGNLAGWCQADGYLGVDISPQVVALARKRFPHHRFETAVPDGQKFDRIILLAVIEHADDPAALLSQLRQELASGGRIVLTTPHPAMGWAHRLGARLRLFSDEAAEEHRSLLDLRVLEAIGEEAGLRRCYYRRFLLGANQIAIFEAQS